MSSTNVPADERPARRGRGPYRLRTLRQPLDLVASFRPRVVGDLLIQTYVKWSSRNAPRLGAALAFYTVFSLAPLILVVLTVSAYLFGEEAARGEIVYQFENYLGRTGAQIAQGVLQSARKPVQGTLAAWLSALTLFLGASLLVSELRNSLNLIWGVPVSDEEVGFFSGIASMLRQRFFAFLMVIGVGFLLFALFLANTFLAAAGKYFSHRLPLPEAVLEIGNFLIGVLITTVLFMLVYKVLPDAHITWKDVAVGAAVTAFLFTAGRLLIALYLGKSGVGSAYGAAGSLVVFLTWIYYSVQVFFFGAEFTEVYATRHGSRLVRRRRRWIR